MVDSASNLSPLDAAMVATASQPKLPNFQNLMGADALLALNLPAPSWFVEHYLPRNAFVFIAGRPKSWKTMFALRMAYALALGIPLFDSAITGVSNPPLPKTRVLFVEEEMQRIHIQQRLKFFTRAGHVAPSDLVLYMNSGFKLSNEHDLKGLADYIRAHEIKVVFLDPFSSVGGFENENDNSEVSRVLDNMRRTLVDSDLGVTVVCINHPSKSDKGALINLRGAGDILGKCDHAMVLERSDLVPQTQITVTDSRIADTTKIPVRSVKFDVFTAVSMEEPGMPVIEKMDMSAAASVAPYEIKK